MHDVVQYPDAIDPAKVGEYSAVSGAGGGYVWDAVLEYRVWCHPERGAPDFEDGSDYYYAFATYAEALQFSEWTERPEEPARPDRLDKSSPSPKTGSSYDMKEVRVPEWPVEFLFEAQAHGANDSGLPGARCSA